MRRWGGKTGLRWLGAVVAVLAAVGALAPGRGGWAAQETPPAATEPPAPFEAYVAAYAVVDGLPPGPATLSVEEVYLPPGEAAELVANPGPVLISVRDGTVVLDTDEAVVTPTLAPAGALRPATPVPGPVADRPVEAGEQVLLPGGAPARLRNPGPDTAVLLVVAIAAGDAAAAPR